MPICHAFDLALAFHGGNGWGGIRTPGAFRHTRFPGVHNQPLCHPSRCWINILQYRYSLRESPVVAKAVRRRPALQSTSRTRRASSVKCIQEPGSFREALGVRHFPIMGLRKSSIARTRSPGRRGDCYLRGRFIARFEKTRSRMSAGTVQGRCRRFEIAE